MAIELKTEIPGPRSREIVARRDAATPPGAARLTPIAVESAEGSVVVDVDGNRLIDLAGGIGVLAVGHCPPGVVDALSAQASRLVHMCAIVSTYEPYVQVAERLNELTPGDFPKKTLLTSTGAEAVEAAVGIARYYTGRQGIVTFEGGYHGRSSLTMAMTSKFALFKKGFGPFAPEVYRFPFPDLYRRPRSFSEDEWIDWHLEKLDDCFISVVAPEHVAAVVVEPLQGEGGFRPAPPAWLQRLRELCDLHGIVLVADEVQSGMGRTGLLFGVEHAGVVPDVVTTAKSLAAGMPLGAVTGRSEIMDSPHPGGLGGTYAGNPLACVAALEALDIIARPEFLARAREVGGRIRARLEKIQSEHPELIGDVRGLGPMLAMEVVTDSESRKPCMEATAAINAATLQRGVITIRAGLYSNCVRFLPPLTISDAEIDEALDVVAEAVDTVAA
ncbi:MAG: 4-aminobutyrate--2-oxoglutarate transaminase [Deltaproteobacteria bacterium]|nr:4-aminobutyrate--2-oxoglutarate transaminase [Deltaproteobacteria bacterium]MBW2420650.1 4-aminobutyrate--2-oxoglutarate transaminase [Deltaproteobacteria bacterium]